MSESTPQNQSIELPTASLGKRLIVIIYDGMALIAMYLIGFALAMVPFNIDQLPKAVSMAIVALITCGFYSFFWMRGGQTVGMRAWKLQLVSTSGKPLNIGNCLARLAVGAVNFAAFGLGYWVALFHPDKRSLLDLASGTKVIQLDKNPNS